MIEEKNVLVAEINNQVNIAANLNIPINYIEPLTQEKSVVPDKKIISITPDDGYTGLSKVIVDKIPDEYITPTDTIEINSNGNYNVKDKEFANVNVPEKQLGTKTITTNGTYKATDDNLDGYSEVNVETSGVDINEYYNLEPTVTSFTVAKCITQVPYIDTSNVTSMISAFQNLSTITQIPKINTSKTYSFSSMFNSCSSLITIPQLDASKVNAMNNMFYMCSSLTTIPLLDTSNVKNMDSMFYACKALETIPQLDTSNVTNMRSMFSGCSKLITIPQLNGGKVENLDSTFYTINLENFGGLLDIGQAYSTSQSTNYYWYQLNLSNCNKLTHDSLMNVINGLYDIKTKGCNPQSLKLGATNLAKLTSEEISICTFKGWSVS